MSNQPRKIGRVPKATSSSQSETPYAVTFYANYDLRCRLEKAARESGRPGLGNGAIAIIKSWLEFLEDTEEENNAEKARKRAADDANSAEDEE